MYQELNNDLFESLSKREKQVLAMMLKGALVKDICKELGLKSNTVSTYKKNIFLKTKTSNIIELFQIANTVVAK